ncbi:hypothetical protein [Paenibacillus spongiae]|uniref:Uncharacterized protein n=1 Tax=Paenibacillus spongiae TaxID=2909671 RepID=A0ABY5SAG9_9BACL|nr:hypothetical protein [Paenibacillus spongiae]UVI29293.1 hypothetical protein L1F29_28320 [Paenibacillus spongiae]
MILRGLVDFNISSGLDPSTLFINECGGGPAASLFRIPDGSIVILQRGSIKKRMRVIKGDASECDFHFAELNPNTARLFRVKAEERFLLVFNGRTRVMKMIRVPVTRDTALFVLDRNRLHENAITLGGPFIDDLGIFSTRKTIIVIRGGVCKRFRILKSRVETPDLFFQLTAANASRFGLNNGKKYRLAYNQITNRLVIGMQVT